MEHLPPPEASVLKLGMYEHWKSTPEDPHFYEVTGTAVDPDTGGKIVIYERMGTDMDEQCYRPLKEFTKMVEVNGTEVPRYRYIG